MKVIDLLNKIANGEEVPKEIKYDTMNYYFRNYDYKEVHGELIDEQTSFIEKIDFYKLNDEIEIIEEPKKIEKLEILTVSKGLLNITNNERILLSKINEQTNKLNEIIDYINNGDSN